MTFLGIKRKICFLLINGIFSGTHFFEIKRKLLIYAGYYIGEKTVGLEWNFYVVAMEK
jgi:hypothetical protein